MHRRAYGLWFVVLAAAACTGCMTRLPLDDDDAAASPSLETLAPSPSANDIDGRIAWLRGERAAGPTTGDVATGPNARVSGEEIRALFRYEGRGRGRSGFGISIGICECRCVPGR